MRRTRDQPRVPAYYSRVVMGSDAVGGDEAIRAPNILPVPAVGEQVASTCAAPRSEGGTSRRYRDGNRSAILSSVEPGTGEVR